MKYFSLLSPFGFLFIISSTCDESSNVDKFGFDQAGMDVLGMDTPEANAHREEEASKILALLKQEGRALKDNIFLFEDIDNLQMLKDLYVDLRETNQFPLLPDKPPSDQELYNDLRKTLETYHRFDNLGYVFDLENFSISKTKASKPGKFLDFEAIWLEEKNKNPAARGDFYTNIFQQLNEDQILASADFLDPKDRKNYEQTLISLLSKGII